MERFSVRNEKLGTEKHATPNQYVKAYGLETCVRLSVFATIRNPWDRAISNFFSPHRGDVVWNREEFIESVLEMPTLREYVTLACESRIDEHLTHLMSFESLARDFGCVCAQLKLPRLALPRRNVSVKQHYSAYYDNELIDLVARRFNEEIELGEYSFIRHV